MRSYRDARAAEAAVAAALVAAAVRLPGAIRDSFWQDEVASARIIVEPTFGAMLGRVRATEATPPLWYALGWFLHELGLTPYGYRFFGLLFGGLLAAATWFLARRLVAPAAAAAATAIVVLGYQFVEHGRELRAYELYALLAVLFALALLRAVERPERGRLVALAVVVAAGCLTNYFAVLFLACGLAWAWAARARRVAAAAVAGFALFVPWLPAALSQYDHHRFSWIGHFRLSSVLSAYWLLAAQNEPATAVLHRLAPYATLALVLLAAAVLACRGGEDRLVALLAVGPVAVAAVVWAAGPEVFDPRNVIGAGPFAAIAVASLLARLPVRAAAPLAAAGLGLLAYGYGSSERTPPTDFEGIAHALVREGWSPRTPIVLYDGNFFAFRGPLEWYLPGRPGLTLGRPTGRPCRGAFAVVAGDRHAQVLAGRLRWADASETTHVTTARLPAPVRLPSRRLRAVHVITAAEGNSACVRPLSESQLAASALP
jgi:Dolichyl-phosphate-mannose-protein mannosyltransferase